MTDEVSDHERMLRGLWKSVDQAEKLAPPPKYFRVAIFGSARVKRGPVYEQARWLACQLTRKGVDIITGGGPGLMEAAARGAADGKLGNTRSIGLAIELPFEEAPNPYLDKEYRHGNYLTRLHHFSLLASAFVVMPGGIGTLLELMLIWQQKQSKHKDEKVPLILVGNMWEGVLAWMRSDMCDKGTMSRSDFDLIVNVVRVEDALPILLGASERFRAART